MEEYRLAMNKKKNRKSAIKWFSLQFYGMIILVNTKPLCRGRAWLPFPKKGLGLTTDRVNYIDISGVD